MKILTLNTHSLAEPAYEEKLLQFVQVVKMEKPDIMGFQEVNQTASAPALKEDSLKAYVPCRDFDAVIREDNHAARLAELLWEAGMEYYFTWLSAKLGYGIYDEGMALFSKNPILETDQFTISKSEDYTNWKTRKILGIRTCTGWYYTVHMGWWEDDEEPFSAQWDCILKHLSEKKEQNGSGLWIMGDFNSPAQVRGEGYDYVEKSGWKDTYHMAQSKDRGITVGKVIDGWRDREGAAGQENEDFGMRIDYIWSRYREAVKYSRVICNGKEYPVVSDHYGVMIETENDEF